MSIYVEIKKDFGAFLLDVQFSSQGGVLALLGPSGCGKSLTLGCVAGIVRPDSGRIEIDGVTLFDSAKGINLTPQERQVGLLFQHYALFPNMTVEENLLTGARREKDRRRRRKMVEEALAAFYLQGLEKHYPAQLSGGQQQRTALARILISQPRLLMLDEPFSALDSHLRWEMEQEVREVIRRFPKPVILVSHDREEVFRLSDQIAVMNAGRIDAMGGKKAVFSRPGTRQSAALTGCKNISRAQKLSPCSLNALDWGLVLETGEEIPEDMSYVGIRAHDIRRAENGAPNSFCLKVADCIENPFSRILMLCKEENGREGPEKRQLLRWELSKEDWRQEGKESAGQKVEVSLPPEALLLLR